MAAVAIEISGVLYDLYARTTQRVVLRGQASLIGLEIGGGPIIPDPLPPIKPPDEKPPSIWPSPGRPAHPIVLPDPPIEGPPVDPPTNPPSPQWSWVFSPSYGWHAAYVPGPTDPQPH